MNFREDMLRRKAKVSEEKAKRFNDGNTKRVEPSEIKKHVKEITAQEVQVAIEKAELSDDMQESDI